MRALWIIMLSSWSFSAVANDVLWESLRRDSNMVVLMRNAESTGNRDRANMLVWDSTGKCVGESMLTASGRSQARRIGAEFEKRGIQATVISSPMCRCTETAKIAFGKYLTDPVLRQYPLDDVQGQASFHEVASALLSKYRGESPMVFVNHRPNIDTLTMELVNIGELLVGTVTKDGEIDVLGKIRLEQ